VPSAEQVADTACEPDQYQPTALERSLTPHSDAPDPLPTRHNASVLSNEA
jgi:hypothetical protein